MSELSPLYDLPAAKPMTCPRCGRIFEGAVTIQGDGEQVHTIRGHVQGDPDLCVPMPTMPELQERDARRRRDKRRGRAPK